MYARGSPIQLANQQVDQLIEQARVGHPSLRSARAQLSAVQANLDLQRAADRPTVSLVAELYGAKAEQGRRLGGDTRLGVTQGRYRAGVGDMTELLEVMYTYTTAVEENIRALNAWQNARLQLAASLGLLGFSDLK